jgi:hypothetical protein
MKERLMKAELETVPLENLSDQTGPADLSEPVLNLTNQAER